MTYNEQLPAGVSHKYSLCVQPSSGLQKKQLTANNDDYSNGHCVIGGGVKPIGDLVRTVDVTSRTAWDILLSVHLGAHAARIDHDLTTTSKWPTIVFVANPESEKGY